jgi:hypothetical protein
MAHVSHTAKAMEGPASPEAAEAATASSSSSSSSKSSKISGLEGSASCRGSGSSSSTFDSHESSDSDSGGVEITLSDKDAKKTYAGIEEGEIAGGSGIATAEEPGENLACVQASPEDLIKTGTCCRMDLPGPATSVGTRTDYSVGPWDYPACATRHLKAWSTRTTQE